MGRAGLKRGDLITAVFSADYGKPRPALVVQSNRLLALDSVLLCPLTSDVGTDGPTRVMVTPDDANGLLLTSLIMVDKLSAVSRLRCRERLGVVNHDIMERVDGLLLFVAGLLD